MNPWRWAHPPTRDKRSNHFTGAAEAPLPNGKNIYTLVRFVFPDKAGTGARSPLVHTNLISNCCWEIHGRKQVQEDSGLTTICRRCGEAKNVAWSPLYLHTLLQGPGPREAMAAWLECCGLDTLTATLHAVELAPALIVHNDKWLESGRAELVLHF